MLTTMMVGLQGREVEGGVDTHYGAEGEDDDYEEEVIDDEQDFEEGLLNDVERPSATTSHDNEEVLFDEVTISDGEYEEEEILDDDDEFGYIYNDDDDGDGVSDEEEIVELSEHELPVTSDDDDDGDDYDESMSGSGDFFDDTSVLPLSVGSGMFYSEDMISISFLDDAATTSTSQRDSKRRQMELHNSAISDGARKAMMEEIAREQSIRNRVARRDLQRQKLEQETERLRSGTCNGEKSNLLDASTGNDSRDNLVEKILTYEEDIQRQKEQDQAARQRLIEEIKKVDIALSKNKREIFDSPTRALSAADMEKKNRALVELRRQAARDELARNNNRLKAAQASCKHSSFSADSLQSTILSLRSPSTSSSKWHSSSLSKENPTGGPILVGLFDLNNHGSISKSVRRDSHEEYGNEENEIESMISRLPGEPPFFRETDVDRSGHSKSICKLETFGTTSVGSKAADESSSTTSNQSQGNCSAKQPSPHRASEIDKATGDENDDDGDDDDDDDDVARAPEEEKAHRSPIETASAIVSSSSRMARNSLVQLEGIGNAPVPGAFRSSEGSPQRNTQTSTRNVQAINTYVSPTVNCHPLLSMMKANNQESSTHDKVVAVVQNADKYHPENTILESNYLESSTSTPQASAVASASPVDRCHPELTPTMGNNQSREILTTKKDDIPELTGATQPIVAAVLPTNRRHPVVTMKKVNNPGPLPDMSHSKDVSVSPINKGRPIWPFKKFDDAESSTYTAQSKDISVLPVNKGRPTWTVKKVDNPELLLDSAQRKDDPVSPVNKRRPEIRALKANNPIPSTKSTQAQDTAVSPGSVRRPFVTVMEINNPDADPCRQTESSSIDMKKESPLPLERMHSCTQKQDGKRQDDSKSEFYPLADLQGGKVCGIDITRREQYLSPDEFELVFKMSKDEFSKLPKWKRDKTKRSLRLF